MMNKNIFIDFQRINGYADLISGIQENCRKYHVSLPRSVRLPFVASLQRDLNCPILFITSKSDRLLTMADSFSFWVESDDVTVFSEPSPLFYEKTSWSLPTRRDRIETLSKLARYLHPGQKKPNTAPIIFSSVKSLITKTIPRRDFLKKTFIIKKNPSFGIQETVEKLYASGYEAKEIVFSGGQYAKRGGILDVWPSNSDLPFRIEYFGDDVDTIRTFNPETQRSMDRVEKVFIPPGREVFDIRKHGVSDEEETGGLGFYIPSVYPDAGTIINYLPKNALILFDNEATLRTIADEIESQSMRFRKEMQQTGSIDPGFPIPYVTWSEIVDASSQICCVDLGFPLEGDTHPMSTAFSPSPRFGSNLEDFFEFLQKEKNQADHFSIVSKQLNRIKEVQREYANGSGVGDKLVFQDGSLDSGWKVIYNDGSVDYLFTDNELFGWEMQRSRTRKRKSISLPEIPYADIKAGEWVVHIDYGIARFGGLVQRKLDGVIRDFLLLEYAEDDQLFVPIHQFDRISVYVGPDSRKPRLSRLGTAEWKNVRTKASHAVQDIARDLLDLYAKRQKVVGHAFESDAAWQKELEMSFPFDETEDQILAIEQVKEDMEKPKPMDRLLCGDVGYGKTEVALRAAFKAVTGNKQAAMLVPTTVLAQQHFATFRSRLSPFPVTVEMLSRFRSPASQKRIIKKLQEGKVDIIIGTHRLLQKDVGFKDLGLLIIDEEQRFGVTHKEYFKQMRMEIDVLTLTATPIPRTLYMALSGIRDISVINSAPAERLPVHTFTGPYDPNVVKSSIIREMDRGGQVFFVHNRVQSIRIVAARLQKLVPEGRFGIAHGQMPEKQLADVMQRFTDGTIDVLVSTSIIESGLDIPNANTLILDRADTFGLAQLYQLRGRVGRASSRAYAYFFHHTKNLPTEEGLERLEIIAENTQLGAGYSIAMRDLEMRGAGDLLGTQQHGYIASVGFHLYTRLLAEAVKAIKKDSGLEREIQFRLQVQELKPLVSIDLPLSAHIPVSYIEDEKLRQQLYRRIAGISNKEKIIGTIEEFNDRFGPVPEALNNLFYQLRIKLKAQEAGLKTIQYDEKSIRLVYPLIEGEKSARNLIKIGDKIRSGKNSYWMPIEGEKHWQIRLIDVLDTLLADERRAGGQLEI